MLISVVVPVYNEESHIRETLEGLLEEKKRNSLIDEIYVIDNYSTDNSFQIISDIDGIHSFQAEGNISQIRNAGAEHCTADIIAFIDGDCVVQPGWSRASVGLVERHKEQWSDIVFGSAVMIPEKATWIESVWFKPISDGSKGNNHINSGNLLMSKALFQRLSGFNVLLSTSEDLDICQRAIEIGAALVEDKTIMVRHMGFPKNIIGFYKREYWHGKGMINSRGGIFHNKALLLSILNSIFLVILVFSVIYMPVMALSVLIIQLIIHFILSTRLCKPEKLVTKINATLLMMTYSTARMIAMWRSIICKVLICRP